MGCPGQARTKPRRKLAVASLSEDRRTAVAATMHARGTRPRATAACAEHGARCANYRGAWRTLRQCLCNRARDSSNNRSASMREGSAQRQPSSAQRLALDKASDRLPCAASTQAAVDSSIRSTTERETPSSACTRRPDEINADGNSSKSWPEQLRRGAAAAAWWPTAVAASEEREAAEWVL
ncbi:hypothetical protein F511_05771 [Dorcoceras hygrometricum]|uniref:Uncharacterized protein n=1 Tax=Dorcoceras hygrometricum TaxID=472368 RepID=A0A2Z7BL41_9LAMI|nr:hypothetical protein F511_05771 [Dorcoceras hygrometricum]